MKGLKLRRTLLAVALSAGLLLSAFSATPARADNLTFVRVVSTHSFSQTVTRLKRAIATNQMMIMGVINMKKMLAMLKVPVKGATNFFIGSPMMAKKMFSMDPAVTGGMPIKISVWVDKDGKTEVGYYPPSQVLGAIDPKLGEGVKMMDGNLKKLVRMVTQ